MCFALGFCGYLFIYFFKFFKGKYGKHGITYLWGYLWESRQPLQELHISRNILKSLKRRSKVHKSPPRKWLRVKNNVAMFLHFFRTNLCWFVLLLASLLLVFLIRFVCLPGTVPGYPALSRRKNPRNGKQVFGAKYDFRHLGLKERSSRGSRVFKEKMWSFFGGFLVSRVSFWISMYYRVCFSF